jgi:hypothetical protein
MKYTITIVKTLVSTASVTVCAENEEEIETMMSSYLGGDIKNSEGYYEVPDWELDDEYYHVLDVEPEE